MAETRTFDPAAHVPRLDGSIEVGGLPASVRIHRDDHGIPHVEAADEASAWFGMGYACAQDRLWQLEWYRRRGRGRWSEVVGSSGLPGDRMFRRLRLGDACRADVEAMSAETRAMFETYAAGVNAYVDAGQPLGLAADQPADLEQPRVGPGEVDAGVVGPVLRLTNIRQKYIRDDKIRGSLLKEFHFQRGFLHLAGLEEAGSEVESSIK